MSYFFAGARVCVVRRVSTLPLWQHGRVYRPTVWVQELRQAIRIDEGRGLSSCVPRIPPPVDDRPFLQR